MQYFFYFFAACLIPLSILVVFSRNPVHSVLFLILVFINAAMLFVLLNAEFVAMLLIVVYVGAVTVLFLFVVIMLGVDNLKRAVHTNRFVIFFVSLLLFCELIIVYLSHNFVGAFPALVKIDTYTIASVLYTDFFYLFQVSGLLLLVAMFGAIILTLETRNIKVRRQKVVDQLLREAKVRLVKS